MDKLKTKNLLALTDEALVLPQFNDNNESWTSIANVELILKSFVFDEEKVTLKVLNQLLVPHNIEFIDVHGTEDGYKVIKQMQVRGAPLIATVGMLSLIVELKHNFDLRKFANNDADLKLKFWEYVSTQCDYLVLARPTAINLTNIVNDLKCFVRRLVSIHEVATNNPDCLTVLIKRVNAFILNWQAKERSENDLLVRNAITALLAPRISNTKKLVILTICNTGSLATSSFGTALGVITHLHRLGNLEMAIVLETRPYFQGSRLTAFELKTNQVPFVLIGDSMAAYAMKTFKIDAVLVGADQVALNGDTANKIGTYMLSVLAHYHQISFYVVTSTSSINPRITDGTQILVEERPPVELIQFNGKYIAPKDSPVWNPAFDVTPAHLITGILTEKGNLAPQNLTKLFSSL